MRKNLPKDPIYELVMKGQELLILIYIIAIRSFTCLFHGPGFIRRVSLLTLKKRNIFLAKISIFGCFKNTPLLFTKRNHLPLTDFFFLSVPNIYDLEYFQLCFKIYELIISHYLKKNFTEILNYF